MSILLPKTTYLEDGVYASWDGNQIKLYTLDDDMPGIVRDEIWIAPHTLSVLGKWIENQMNEAAGKKKSILEDC